MNSTVNGRLWLVMYQCWFIDYDNYITLIWDPAGEGGYVFGKGGHVGTLHIFASILMYIWALIKVFTGGRVKTTKMVTMKT